MSAEELKSVTQRVGEAFTEFKSHYNSRLDDIEKKLGRPGALGTAANADTANPTELLTKSIRCWYPERGPISVDADAYQKAFDTYVRQGTGLLGPDELKAMQAGVDPDGGYLVPGQLYNGIVRSEQIGSAIRSIAFTLPIGGPSIDIPASLTNPAVGWVSETGSRSETTSPTFGNIKLTAGEIYCAPKATQQLLDDAQFGVDSLLSNLIGEALGEAEDLAFISGDGVGKPRGFTTYTTAATADATRDWTQIQHIATGQAGAWPTTDDGIHDVLVDVVQALRPGYRRGAVWVMGNEAITKISKLKDQEDRPLWRESLAAGQPATLLGYPIVQADQMPAVGANSLSVAFGNFQRAYWIVDRTGIRILRDPYTNKPYVIFYTTKRVGGGVVDTRAIKLLKFAAA